MSLLRSLLITCLAVACDDPYAVQRDAGIDGGSEPDSVELSGSDDGATCTAAMLETDSGLALVWAQQALDQPAEVIYQEFSPAGATLMGPTVITTGAVDSLALIKQGDGFMAIVGRPGETIGFDLSSAGAALGSGPLTGLAGNPKFIQVDAQTYWVVYHRNVGGRDRVFYRTFGPMRSAYSAEQELLLTGGTETDPVVSATGDGVWLSYRIDDEVRIVKVDLDGAISVGPNVVTNALDTPRPSVAANNAGLLVEMDTFPFGTPDHYYYQLFDPSGISTTELVDYAATRYESAGSMAEVNSRAGYIAREDDSAGRLGIALERIDFATGSHTSERITNNRNSARCATVVATDEWVALSYIVSAPEPVRVLRFVSP